MASAVDITEDLQRACKLHVERRKHRYACATVRMNERKASRVQQHPVHPEHAERPVMTPVAVAAVANEVVRGVLEMAADLAEAPAMGLRTQQRVARCLETGRGRRQ